MNFKKCQEAESEILEILKDFSRSEANEILSNLMLHVLNL
jgi:hypothetical protein